jgi:cytochrome c heme-lyase
MHMSSEDNQNSGDASECPVGHGKQASAVRSWKIPFTEHSKGRPSSGGCPVKHDDLPFKHEDKKAPFGLPPSIEESAKHPQSPFPDQQIPLSTRRIVSSIPRADELRPEEEGKVAPHQPHDQSQWVYPSEQQFYNAMRRKGWQGVDERTIPAVVRIHNAVNERGWTEVRQWERELHGCDEPRLVRFLGRPKDLTPRAWVQTYIFGNRPFDRHDWYIDRGDGKEPRRYVIDFYAEEKSLSPNAQRTAEGTRMYLDVRPALDTPEAVFDRVKMLVHDAFPGIFGLFKSQQTPTSRSASDSNNHPDGRGSAS